MFDFEEFKCRVANSFDPDALVDMLGITSEELLEAFEDKLFEHRALFYNLED